MWQRLEKWQNNLDVGMTKDRYLAMCEQMGQEPSETKCPPEYEDFPVPLQQAIEVFNRLGDRVYPDIGYMGKDYTALPLHMKVVGVTEEDIFLEALVRLDASLIKRSADQMKKARDSVKKKGNG
jgi:hypothetical protein